MTMYPPATIHYQLPGSSGTIVSPPATTTPTNIHGPIGSKNIPNESMVVALRWLTAIQEATQCLRDRPLLQNEESSNHSVYAIENALMYLAKLEAILKPLEGEWDKGPSLDPPKFVPYQDRTKGKNQRRRASKGSPTSVAQRGGDWTTVSNKNANRFAVFASTDDEDDEEHCLKGPDDEAITGKTILSSCTRSTGSNSFDDLLEAGDVPTLNRIAHFPTGNVMGMRRLMIRIVTAQSELFAYQASGYRRRQLWSNGAKNCHASLCKIHQGLILADSEISRCLAQGGSSLRERQPLMEDAAIVEVAVKALTLECDSFVQKALVAKHQLVRKLEAMYIGRYKARMRLGDKWFQGGRKQQQQPGGYQELRDQRENELVEVQVALDNLGQWDTQTLIASADHLKLRLTPTPAASMVPPRNNQKRPQHILDRVNLTLYPDPSLFGWKFTGSYIETNGARMEFFEKHNMLLDWHYASGELELKWKSPKGHATCFRSEGPLHSNFYLEIVRAHEPWKAAKKYMKHSYH